MKILTSLIVLALASCATHSMTFYNGPQNRPVTSVHENPMHLSLFNGMVEPNSVKLGEECGADEWVRIDQDDSFVNRHVAQATDGTVTPKSITIHCGPPVGGPAPAAPPYADEGYVDEGYADEGAPGAR